MKGREGVNILLPWDFPGSPVVKTPCFQSRGVGLISGGELRSHMPCGVTKTTTVSCFLSGKFS